MAPTPQPKLSPSLDLLCGAAAGTAARLVVAPLDVLKIRFQVQSSTRGLYAYSRVTSAIHSIVSTEGVRALWKGNVPALMMVTPYAALQLAAFYQLRQNKILTAEPYASLLQGAFAGGFATVCTYPLDLLRTRFAAQTEPKQYHTLRHAVALIYTRDGMRGFYAGLVPTLIEIVPYISLHFAFYEGAKDRALKGRDGLQTYETLAIGAASGTASKLVTLPLDNAKKLMQVDGQFGGSGYRGMADVLTGVWKRDGIRGWFRGVTPSLMKAAPNSAITFAVYETAKRAFAPKGK